MEKTSIRWSRYAELSAKREAMGFEQKVKLGVTMRLACVCVCLKEKL